MANDEWIEHFCVCVQVEEKKNFFGLYPVQIGRVNENFRIFTNFYDFFFCFFFQKLMI